MLTDLARRDRVAAADDSPDTGKEPVAVVEANPGDAGFARRRGQPLVSAIRIEKHPDGVTITVPPAGVWRGSQGLFLASLLWCGVMTLFSGCFGFALATGPNADRPSWVVVPFIAAF